MRADQALQASAARPVGPQPPAGLVRGGENHQYQLDTGLTPAGRASRASATVVLPRKNYHDAPAAIGTVARAPGKGEHHEHQLDARTDEIRAS